MNSLPEKDRFELISRNKLLKTIHKYEKKCPNTLLDIFKVGVKNRNCLEPTFDNYCSGIKASPNVDGFSELFGDSSSSETNPNPLFLFFKYVDGTTVDRAQRDLVCFSLLTLQRHFVNLDHSFIQTFFNESTTILV